MLETMTANVIISMIDVHMYVVLSKQKNTCLKGNWLIPLNVKCYVRSVALSGVVITAFKCIIL